RCSSPCESAEPNQTPGLRVLTKTRILRATPSGSSEYLRPGVWGNSTRTIRFERRKTTKSSVDFELPARFSFSVREKAAKQPTTDDPRPTIPLYTAPDMTTDEPSTATAVAEHEAGRLDKAEAIYRARLSQYPDDLATLIG